MKIAVDLRFPPFDRDKHSASFYRWLKKAAHESDEQLMKFKEVLTDGSKNYWPFPTLLLSFFYYIRTI
jgi:hypothetical protein